MQAETNLVRCSECECVYIYCDIVLSGGDKYKPCPNCGKRGTMMPAYTTSDSPAQVFFKRVTAPAVEVEAENRNRDVNYYVDQELRSFQVAASGHIYKGAFVGRTLGGYARPLEAGDLFMGIAHEEMDNTTRGRGAVSIRVYTLGDFGLGLLGAVMSSIGRAVFASSDTTLTFARAGNSYVGYVQDVIGDGKIILRLDTSPVGRRVFSEA